MRVRFVRVVALTLALTGTVSHAYAQATSRRSGHLELDFRQTGPSHSLTSLILEPIFSPSIAYVHSVGDGPYSLGGRVGYAWEWHHTTLDGSVFESISLDFVGRRHFRNADGRIVAHVEAGPTMLTYYWADDCSRCSGRFGGLYVAAGVGGQRLSVGVSIRSGWATLGSGGPNPPSRRSAGILWSPYVRLGF